VPSFLSGTNPRRLPPGKEDITFAVFCEHGPKEHLLQPRDRARSRGAMSRGQAPGPVPQGRARLRDAPSTAETTFFGRARPGASSCVRCRFRPCLGDRHRDRSRRDTAARAPRRRTKRGLVAETPLHAPHSPALSLAASTLSTLNREEDSRLTAGRTSSRSAATRARRASSLESRAPSPASPLRRPSRARRHAADDPRRRPPSRSPTRGRSRCRDSAPSPRRV
jgi:hypothetical protein